MQDKRLWMGVGLIHGGSSLGLAVDIDAPASDGLRSEAAEHAFVRSQRRLPASRRRNLEGDSRPGGDFLEIVAMRARATPHRSGTSKERCFEIVSGWSPMRSTAVVRFCQTPSEPCLTADVRLRIRSVKESI